MRPSRIVPLAYDEVAHAGDWPVDGDLSADFNRRDLWPSTVNVWAAPGVTNPTH